MMKVTINGKQETIDQPMTLKSFLEQRGVNPNVVACELNLKIIKRAQLDQTELKEGDQLEILQMIGGG